MENKISKAAFLSILTALEKKPVVDVDNSFSMYLDVKDIFDVLRKHCEEQISDRDLDYYLF